MSRKMTVECTVCGKRMEVEPPPGADPSSPLSISFQEFKIGDPPVIHATAYVCSDACSRIARPQT